MSITLDTPGLSLYSIPIVYLTAFYPHNAKVRLIHRTVGYNNIAPRTQDADALAKKGMPKDTIDKVNKMAGAHQNGLEIFPVWAAAVLAANMAGIDQRHLNIISAAFIGSRLLFNWIYFNQNSAAVSLLRTLTWTGSIGLPLYLFVKAGNKLRLAA